MKRKEKRKEKRAKNILKATMESDEGSLEEFFDVFCFIANDEEEEIDDELLYQNIINVDKINKD